MAIEQRHLDTLENVGRGITTPFTQTCATIAELPALIRAMQKQIVELENSRSVINPPEGYSNFDLFISGLELLGKGLAHYRDTTGYDEITHRNATIKDARKFAARWLAWAKGLRDSLDDIFFQVPATQPQAAAPVVEGLSIEEIERLAIQCDFDRLGISYSDAIQFARAIEAAVAGRKE